MPLDTCGNLRFYWVLLLKDLDPSVNTCRTCLLCTLRTCNILDYYNNNNIISSSSSSRSIYCIMILLVLKHNQQSKLSCSDIQMNLTKIRVDLVISEVCGDLNRNLHWFLMCCRKSNAAERLWRDFHKQISLEFLEALPWSNAYRIWVMRNNTKNLTQKTNTDESHTVRSSAIHWHKNLYFNNI